MGRKAQATIFVILGIVILLVVSLLITAQQRVLEQRMQQEAEESINDFLALNSINHYVTSCLDTVAAQGLHLLGEQGGVIYDYQGGLTPTGYGQSFVKGVHYIPYSFRRTYFDENNTLKYRFETRNVSYGMKRFVNCPSFYPPRPIDYTDEITSYYPVKDTPFSKFEQRYMSYTFDTPPGCMGFDSTYQFSGYMGANMIPKLCHINGSNKPYELREGNPDPTEQRNPCRWQYYDTSAKPTSIQNQLDTYVENNIGQCVNLSVFTKRVGNISVDETDIRVKSILQDPSGIIMNAYYPFEITLPNGNIYIHDVSFQSKFSINIKTIYSYIFDLFSKWARDPYFDLLEDWDEKNETTNKYYHSTFELEYERQACTDCTERGVFDDVITITDKGSLLNRKPYSMTFALQDRKPVLDFMNDPYVTGSYKGKEIDYQYYTNATITLTPQAVDADLDNITYHYNGWMEDYVEKLNYTCCQKTNKCNVTHYNETDCYLGKDSTVSPHNWTRSELYKKTGRVARFKTDVNDTGFHEVIVTAEDEHGKKDFQIVKLLIFDLPQALLKMGNYYDDVNNKFASVEDMYLLNGTGSNASKFLGGSISNYIFMDKTEPFTKNSTTGILILGDAPANHSTIPQYNFMRSALNSKTSLRHDMLLYVEQNTTGSTVVSEPVYGQVNVTQCLPHRYTKQKFNSVSSPSPLSSYYDNPDITPSTAQSSEYYWNIPNNDYYGVPHVCCRPLDTTTDDDNLSGGKWASQDTSCFEIRFNTTYPSIDVSEPYAYLNASWYDNGSGVLKKYDHEYYENVYDDADLYPDDYPLDTTTKSSVSKDDLNDVFEVSYRQNCSGTSGRMCAGAITTIWDRTDCLDGDESNPSHPLQASDPFARCQGPGSKSDDPFESRKAGEDVDGKLVCANFSSGESFEKDVLGISASTISSEGLSVSLSDAVSIGNGQCAENETGFDIQIEQNIPTVKKRKPLGDFQCEATCSGENGLCMYHDYTRCSCEDGDNACDGVSAEDLFDNNGDKREVCINDANKDSCDSDCKSHSTHYSLGACYCDIKGSAGDVSPQSYKKFFEVSQGSLNIYENGNIKSQDSACCTKDSIIYNADGRLCYKGGVYDQNDQPDVVSEENLANIAILAYNGYFHCCYTGSTTKKPEYCTGGWYDATSSNNNIVGSYKCTTSTHNLPKWQ
ncbi:MAG: hypothetical protein ACOCU6_00410 [Nanoarchaeota archaeon]